jgi:hypothetical protein
LLQKSISKPHFKKRCLKKRITMDEGHDSSEDEDYLFLPSEIIEGKLYLSCASVASKTELIKKYTQT